MKIILLLGVVLVGLSCNKEKEKKENQFMPVVRYYIANEIGLDLSKNGMDLLAQELRALETTYQTVDSVQFVAYNVQATLRYLTEAHIEKSRPITVIVDRNLNAITAEDFIK